MTNRRDFFRLIAGAAAIVATGPATLVAPIRQKRKLKAFWSVEAAEDLRSQHNLPAEEELTKILAREINQGLHRGTVNGVGWSRSAGKFVI